MELCFKKDTRIPMFIAALFTIANDEAAQSAQEQMIDLGRWTYLYAVEYYSAIKRMKYCHLKQHGQTQRIYAFEMSAKDKYNMISLTCDIKIIQRNL